MTQAWPPSVGAVPVAVRAVLHIGAFKTGTTFLQACMKENSEALAYRGVLIPERQREALEDLRRIGRGEHNGSTGAWHDLAQQVHAWTGPSAVVSKEGMSGLNEVAVTAAIHALQPMPVRVIYGVRDLKAVIPSQWQTSLRGTGQTWTLEEYVAGVTAELPQDFAAGRSFWKKHDWPTIVARWQQAGPSGGVTLLVTPKQRRDPSLIWRMFAQAAEIDVLGLPVPGPARESLGAASTEVVRQVNLRLAETKMKPKVRSRARNIVKGDLSYRCLAARSSGERRIALPEGLDEWLAETTQRQVEKLSGLDVPVVGDLADLTPAPGQIAGETNPELSADADIRAAADDAVRFFDPAAESAVGTLSTAELLDQLTAHIVNRARHEERHAALP